MKIKICGIKDSETLNCCSENNVDYFGLLFYEKSPRNINLKKASELRKTFVKLHHQTNK